MYSFRQIEAIVKTSANALPLDVFAFLGSFLEEIIPPIPAPLIMTTAGSLSLTQHHTWLFLLWIAIVGAIGKTIASWVFYVLGDKFEDIVVVRFGKFVGINHKDVENLGKRFNGGWGDEVALFVLRSIPIFPSVSVSIVCGIIRLNMRTFISATFLGTIVKNLIYLYVGYGGMRAVGFFVRKIHNAHFWIGAVFVIVSVGLIYWLVRKKKQERE
ncbi:MAG: VTT domain-containing protein [Candidatus Moranbacteria bacterium]|nr:VTT domain-containing protein [Candidatus Moranbacteria bacterium]